VVWIVFMGEAEVKTFRVMVYNIIENFGFRG